MSDNEGPWMGRLPAAPGCDCHVCRPDAGYAEDDQRVIDTVLRHGWQVMLVGAASCCSDPEHGDHSDDEPDGARPAFAYTIGLAHRCGHPELLISGLDIGLMHSVLNSLAERIMDGLRLAPGDCVEDVLAGVPVAVEQVSDSGLAATVTWAGWFQRRRPDALAIVWPDRRGVFAWQPGAPEVLASAQPAAWRAPIAHTGGLAPDPAWEFPVAPDHPAFTCTHVVEGGEAVLWALREPDPEHGEDWSLHCGATDHADDDIRSVHLSHLVRSAPSLRELSGLSLDVEAWRDTPDSAWETAPVPGPAE